MAFTNSSIRAATYKGDGASQYIIWDEGTKQSVTSLGARIFPPNAKGECRKSFVLGYRCFDRSKGKVTKRLHTLGKFGEMTIAEARDEAKEWKRDVRNGIDPKEKRKPKTGPVSPTFRFVVDEFIEKYAKPRQRTWDETERVLEVNCADWLDRRIATITKADAYSKLEGFQADGHESKARKTYAWLRTMFGWAVKRDHLERSVMEGLDIEFEIGATTRRYDDDEVKAIWIGADKLEPVDAAYTKLLLLLCVRKNELAGIRDSELDDAEYPTVWTVPNSRTKSAKRKTERIYIVPLPKLAQRVIKGLPRSHDELLLGVASAW